jgi:hypothetical protein
MATAIVFIDDAVLGRLPSVCAKTGVETVDHLNITVPVGGSDGLGVAWLLLLAGPFGWIGLGVYAMGRRSETITVRLPYSDAAYAQLSQARRVRRNAGLASLALFVLGLFLLIPQTFTSRVGAAALAVLGLGMLISYLAQTFHCKRLAVRVALDGSRRWVTLSGVSDVFAEAVRRSEADHFGTRR